MMVLDSAHAGFNSMHHSWLVEQAPESDFGVQLCTPKSNCFNDEAEAASCAQFECSDKRTLTSECDENFSCTSTHDLESNSSIATSSKQPIIQKSHSALSLVSCHGCGFAIADRTYYSLCNDRTVWHADCLRCSVCKQCLLQAATCHVKDNLLYCKPDYSKNFSVRCARCARQIQATDWIRRAKNMTYHLACFACDHCKRQLSTGEQYAIVDGSVLCKKHYVEATESPRSDNSLAKRKAKSKRIRTAFTEEQVRILQSNFALDSNPDSQDLERLARLAGLSKRVTQVWFQNSRAREKKRHKQGKVSEREQESSSYTLELDSHLFVKSSEQGSSDDSSILNFYSPNSQRSVASGLSK